MWFCYDCLLSSLVDTFMVRWLPALLVCLFFSFLQAEKHSEHDQKMCWYRWEKVKRKRRIIASDERFRYWLLVRSLPWQVNNIIKNIYFLVLKGRWDEDWLIFSPDSPLLWVFYFSFSPACSFSTYEMFCAITNIQQTQSLRHNRYSHHYEYWIITSELGAWIFYFTDQSSKSASYEDSRKSLGSGGYESPCKAPSNGMKTLISPLAAGDMKTHIKPLIVG